MWQGSEWKIQVYHTLIHVSGPVFFFFLAPQGCTSGEKWSRPMASSGKPLGHSSTDLCPGSKNYTPERDAGGTRDHFGNGRQCSPRRTLQRSAMHCTSYHRMSPGYVHLRIAFIRGAVDFRIRSNRTILTHCILWPRADGLYSLSRRTRATPCALPSIPPELLTVGSWAYWKGILLVEKKR